MYSYLFRGESAFTSLLTGFGWAKNPMINRIQHLDNRVPITFIYGQNTWMDRNIGEMVKKDRPNSYVNIEVYPLKILIIRSLLNYNVITCYRQSPMLVIMFLLINMKYLII